MKSGKKITVLKEARKSAKKTQIQIAEELGVSRMTVTYWENGQMNPVAKDLYKISKAYELSDIEIVNWIKQISED